MVFSCSAYILLFSCIHYTSSRLQLYQEELTDTEKIPKCSSVGQDEIPSRNTSQSPLFRMPMLTDRIGTVIEMVEKRVRKLLDELVQFLKKILLTCFAKCKSAALHPHRVEMPNVLVCLLKREVLYIVEHFGLFICVSVIYSKRFGPWAGHRNLFRFRWTKCPKKVNIAECVNQQERVSIGNRILLNYSQCIACSLPFTDLVFRS